MPPQDSDLCMMKQEKTLEKRQMSKLLTIQVVVKRHKKLLQEFLLAIQVVVKRNCAAIEDSIQLGNLHSFSILPSQNLWPIRTIMKYRVTSALLT